MANLTTNLDQIASNQSAKETTANGLIDAESPSALFGRHASACAALTWAYYGGTLNVDGVLTQIANGTLSLTASSTCYVEADRAGTVSFNTTGFTAGRTPLYQITTGSATVTNYLDYRCWGANPRLTGILTLSVAGSANVTLTRAQAANDVLQFTGLLTGNIQVIVPLAADEWIVYNNTTGAFSLTVIGATGTGVAVTQGQRVIVYSDGTNVVQAAVSSGGAGMSNPMTTAGDIIDGGSSGTPQRLAIGTTGQQLTVVAGAPAWASNQPPVNAQTGTTYTLALTDAPQAADCMGRVTMNNASANTLTVPTHASVAFPTNTTIAVTQLGAGQTTIAAAGGVTINNPGGALTCRARYSTVVLMYEGSDVWTLGGDMT
jgi:hypothetical protein